MTTLQMRFAPHLLTSFTEDAMELTLDMDQRAAGADDIDIDLDLTGDNQRDEEDEFMGEEDMDTIAEATSVHGPEAHAASDDVMADHRYAQGLVDEVSSVPDEYVEDAEYISPELGENTVVEPDSDDLNEQNDELSANYEENIEEQNHDQQDQQAKYNQQEHYEQTTKPETAPGSLESAIPNGSTELATFNNVVANIATETASEWRHLAISKEATANPGSGDQTSRTSNVEGLVAAEAKLEQVRNEVLPVSLDQAVTATSDVEESHARGEDNISGAAHLHPIVLDYQGDEMFLFPPIDQDREHAATFLLADEQLAYGTIGRLFEACRCVLKESLSEQDELMIDIHDLDLHISESTIECASTKLSQVVDLYFRLQQNDGLENPPPLYIDLIARYRFSCRLNVLRNASNDGTGLSQLKSQQDAEIVQQHSFEDETDTVNYANLLSINEDYASKQQSEEEAEGSRDQYASHGHAAPSENPIGGANSGAQLIQSYPLKDSAHEQIHPTEALHGGDSSPLQLGASDLLLSEFPGSKESLEPAQAFAGDSELQKAEKSIVDEGDVIDYEDVDDLKGSTSSASSTLHGDTIDTHAIRYEAARSEPIDAQNQEQQARHDVQKDTVPDEKRPHDYADDEDTVDIGASGDEERTYNAVNPVLCSDDNSQSVSTQLDDKDEASESDQDAASTSQGTESQLVVNADVPHEAPAQYEEGAGSYLQNTLHEHANQAESDAYPSADTESKGEVENYSMTQPIDSELGGSPEIYRDNDLRSVNGLEAEHGLEETDALSAYSDNDDNDNVPGLLEEVNTRPSSYIGESVRTQEEDEDDEITYEDEGYHVDSPYEPAQASHNATTSPGSLKRARSHHEDDVILEKDLQGFKRVRSG